MRMALPVFNQPDCEANEGQALVEYLIMVAISIALVLVLQSGFRSGVGKLWSYYAQNIAAGCPGACKPTTNLPW